MKKIISLGSVLATVVLLGAGCNVNINTPANTTPTDNTTATTEQADDTSNETSNQNNTETTTQNTNTNTVTNPITYTNPEFHFSLTLPATWTGYTTKTTENDLGGKTVWIGLSDWDDMFAISVYPTEVNPHPNMRYFGTNGQVYYYGGQSQYIKIESLDARWREISTIMDSFTVANLDDGTQSWQTYSNATHNFTIKYPTTYKTAVDTAAWTNSVVNFIETAPGAQSYRAVISVWNSLEQYKASNVYSAMKYSSRKVGDKYIVISYHALDSETNIIEEWTNIINSLKITN
ncbi:MAG: hypothetical protein WC070_00735 [Candidatus Magasanikbacteria bacterium]